VLDDPNIDQMILRAPRGAAASIWAKSFVEQMKGVDKLAVINWPTSPDDNADVAAFLEEHRIPIVMAPGRTVHALARVNEYAQRKRAFDARRGRTEPRAIGRQSLELPASAGTLGEHRSKAILEKYGVPVVKEVLLSPEAVGSLEREPLPFPLAVKVESADIPHKTEAGVVKLGISDLQGLKRAAREVLEAAQHHDAKARIDGVLVQQMASGLEVIVGAVNDRFFGPVVAFGLGGVYTELLKDVTYRFAPFGVETAREMIGEIKGAALLKGYRGSAPLDVDALADALSRVSHLIADHADRIAEIDVNPLFVRPAGEGVLAADALVVLKA
jgi:acetate---CoA ligase (ADP-forming)